jgi:DNA-binding NarL/FixJ family response regulator
VGRHRTKSNNGCELWPDCFTCPYPDCRYGNEKYEARLTIKATAIKLINAGYTEKQVAEKLSKSIRTIQRYRKGVINN